MQYLIPQCIAYLLVSGRNLLIKMSQPHWLNPLAWIATPRTFSYSVRKDERSCNAARDRSLLCHNVCPPCCRNTMVYHMTWWQLALHEIRTLYWYRYAVHECMGRKIKVQETGNECFIFCAPVARAMLTIPQIRHCSSASSLLSHVDAVLPLPPERVWHASYVTSLLACSNV